MDSSSPVARVLAVLVPAAVLAGLGALIATAALKGRWWAGVVGAIGLVGGFTVGFGAFGFPEPSAEFQETTAFALVNAGVIIAFVGGLALLVYGAVASARPGSRWDRRRGAGPPSPSPGP